MLIDFIDFKFGFFYLTINGEEVDIIIKRERKETIIAYNL